jgi:hypothetical protein
MRGRPRTASAAAGAAALAAALLLPASSGADPVERTSTLADVRSVNLTIYNGALALVHDRRRLELQQGDNRVAWRDVGASMDATSAVLADLSVPGAVRVVEQNFNFDLLKPSTILDKFVGRDVTVVHDKPLPGQPVRETAKLLADNDGVVLQFADRVETGLTGSHIVFGSLPRDLRDRPTLVLDLVSDRAGSADLDLSYLTDGLGWSANYVGVVSPQEDRMDLQGLITLSNTSGTSFPNARLQLVAGNVNVAAPPLGAMESPMAANADRYAVTQQNFFEYHLYTLAQPTSVLNNQTKQVSLLSARRVPIRKTLELRGSDAYYSNPDADLGAKLKVGVYVTFTNRGGDLGVPLPGGVVRLYKNDAGGTSQFLGSDQIDHTPRNEDVRLHLGDSFDVTANKKQLTFHSLGGCSFASSYRIVLANAKTEPATVLVVEPIPGDWSITAENLRHRKTSSATASWAVRVPADGKATLEYSAHVRLCI